MTGSRYFVAEVKCYWCAAVAGTLEGGWPLIAGTVKFHRAMQCSQSVAQTPWFRCTRCGGPLLVDDFNILRLRSDLSAKLDEKPRRGRPRKRPQ